MFGKNLVAALVLSAPALAADYTLTLAPENTSITWSLADPLHTVHGAFSLKSGDVDFDPDTGKASGEVVVDVTSGNSGSEARDRRMHSTVLESERYPDATFVPLRIEGKLAMPGASRVRLIGTFTILGVAHELSMDVQSTVTGDQIRAVIRFEIPYVAWGMKDPSNFLLKVDKKVPVLIEATGSLQKH